MNGRKNIFENISPINEASDEDGWTGMILSSDCNWRSKKVGYPLMIPKRKYVVYAMHV